jgi:hypothetical protein
MGMLDTLIHGETAFLANVAQKIVVNQVTLGDESGFEDKHRVVFKEPRTLDYQQFPEQPLLNDDITLKRGISSV